MDFLQILRALLTGVYKMSDTEVDSLIDESTGTQESVLADILARDKTRVQTLLNPKNGRTFQDGYKKAKAEVLAAHEKELREKYGIEDEAGTDPLTGVELVAAIVQKEAPEAGKNALTEDAIKKHPIYLRLEKEVNKKVTNLEAEWKKKLEDKDKEFTKVQSFGEVSKSVLSLLDELNPIFSTNPKVAETQRKDFIREFEALEYEKAEDGTFIILKDGKRLEDAHGNPILLGDMVKEKADYRFDFAANNGGENGGGGKDPKQAAAAGAYPKGVKKPKTLEELVKISDDPKLSEADKLKVLEVWETENPNS